MLILPVMKIRKISSRIFARAALPALALALVPLLPAATAGAGGLADLLRIEADAHDVKTEGGQPPDGFQAPLHRVNIVGRDDRNSIDHFSRTISPAEQHWIAQVTGSVECLASPTFAGTTGSASLVGSTAKIVTVAHNFYDEQHHLPSPLPSCFFRTKANPRHRIPLVFEPGRFKIGLTFFDASRDYAIVSLAQPVAGVMPLAFGGAPAEGDELILISARASHARKPIDTSQPVARLCHVHKSFSAMGNANSFFRGDCDTSAGDSGGIYLARRSGRLEAVGLHHGGGLPEANGLDYDDTTSDQSRKSYSLGIAFGPAMLQDFRAVQ